MTDTQSAELLSVRLPRDLIVKAKSIATDSSKTIAAILDAAARPSIERQYRKLIAREAAELGGESGT